jgi:tRNA(His) 5'-end guanylyltransferase
MRQEPAFFDNHDARLVYIAKKLKESLAVELLFCQNGIDYGVEPDRYRGGFIFQSERVGAFFYVRPEAEEQTRTLLTANGYRPAPPEDKQIAPPS